MSSKSTHDDRSGLTEPGDDGAVFTGDIVVVGVAAARVEVAFDIELVLDANRDAMHGASVVSRGNLLFRLLCLGQRFVRQHQVEGMELGVVLFDALPGRCESALLVIASLIL